MCTDSSVADLNKLNAISTSMENCLPPSKSRMGKFWPDFCIALFVKISLSYWNRAALAARYLNNMPESSGIVIMIFSKLDPRKSEPKYIMWLSEQITLLMIKLCGE